MWALLTLGAFARLQDPDKGHIKMQWHMCVHLLTTMCLLALWLGYSEHIHLHFT